MWRGVAARAVPARVANAWTGGARAGLQFLSHFCPTYSPNEPTVPASAKTQIYSGPRLRTGTHSTASAARPVARARADDGLKNENFCRDPKFIINRAGETPAVEALTMAIINPKSVY